MSATEKRELMIEDPNSGGRIYLEREGTSVRITRVKMLNYDGEEAPIELDAEDRRALIELLNMGERR